ncbi:MAG: cysteine desulfurase [Chloroflexi bacterium]|nr:MAG: cysteine desulfurase [Chloroflexota bacterium]
MAVYLDHNATTPLDPQVVAAMRHSLEALFGNPSSGHAYGEAAAAAVAAAREQVAALLGCRPGEVTFTSGGTESNNLALVGAVAAARRGAGHLVTSVVEHPSVLEVCRHLERRWGCAVTYLAVDGEGRVDPDDVGRALTPATVAVSIMHANNETGVLQPIAVIARVVREHGVLLHTDAAQSVGKVAARVDELGADLLTVAAHKLYGPKGVGALYVRDGVSLDPVLRGAGQERGLRPGTENVAGITGLGAACAAAAEAHAAGETDRVAALRDRLWQALRADGWRRNGHPTEVLPNTLNVSADGADGMELLARAPEVAASTGSACHTGRTEPSPVLAAMGVPEARALGAVRLSLGRSTTEADVDAAAAALVGAARAAREGRAVSPALR